MDAVAAATAEQTKVLSIQWALSHAHLMIEWFPVTFSFKLHGELFFCEGGRQCFGPKQYDSNSIACLVRDLLRAFLRNEAPPLSTFDCEQVNKQDHIRLSDNPSAQAGLVDAIQSLTGHRPRIFHTGGTPDAIAIAW